MNRRTISQEQFWNEAVDRFGKDPLAWQFVCPMCGTRQSAQTLIAAGVPRDKVEGYVAFSCVGRFTGKGDEGIGAKLEGRPWQDGCNWTLGGLLQMHELEIMLPDGSKRFCFELAPL